MAISETRTEQVAQELLEIRGWSNSRPPRGHVLWKNEYRDIADIRDILASCSKSGDGPGYPDFIVVSKELHPLIVGEAKADPSHLWKAVHEASAIYASAFAERGINVLAAGIAGNEKTDIQVAILKQNARSAWQEITYQEKPIQWIPTPVETTLLLKDKGLFDLKPQVPSTEVLSSRAEELNRILRECSVNDTLRPAVIAAFMLGLWQSQGNIRTDPDFVLIDINSACKQAFNKAGKSVIANSIMVPQDNAKLANRAGRIVYLLRLLNITTLTSEHDYLGQLYETFFRFTGGNTIGQFFTPRHIADFVTELVNVQKSDYVIDPTCGTGGFLISALYRMIGHNFTSKEVTELVSDHLKGFEEDPITAALCVANMILRGDGTTGIVRGDCFTDPSFPENQTTIALGNPPFPHKKTDDPPEKFIDRALESLRARGKLAMVVPASLLVKSTKKEWRNRTLRDHALEAVITLPNDLFQPYAKVTTAIIVLEKGQAHRPDRKTFFCHIGNDGFKMKKNIRVAQAGSQLEDALSCFNDRKDVPGFCTWAVVSSQEWAPGAFIETVESSSADIKREAKYLFGSYAAFNSLYASELNAFEKAIDEGVTISPYSKLSKRVLKTTTNEPNTIGTLFDVYYGQKDLHSKENLLPGTSLIVSSTGVNNGCYGFFEFEKLIQPPFTTVPSTGSIGEAFVQTWPCGVTDDCLLLFPKKETRPELMYVAASVLRLERWRFNYGRKITPDRIAHFKIPTNKNLVSWFEHQILQARGLVRDIRNALGKDDVDTKFQMLVKRWKTGRSEISSLSKMALHPAYQQIIGMGARATPLILEELRREPDYWFWALTAIEGVDPVPEESRGKLEEMTEAWLAWGRRKRLIRK